MCACTVLQTPHSTLQPSPDTWTLLIHFLFFASKETFSTLMHCLLPTLSSVTESELERPFSSTLRPCHQISMFSNLVA